MWDTQEEFEHDLAVAWSWYSPTSGYKFVQNPTYLGAAKAAWVPTLSFSTFMAFNYAMRGAGGIPSLSYWSANVWASRMQTIRATGTALGYAGRSALALATSPITTAMMISVIASVQYEQSVNEPLREAVGETSQSGGGFWSNLGSWRGPFVSGFGSVV